MVAHIVVTEGLAYENVEKIRKCSLSDYYEAVLIRILDNVPQKGRIFFAPGNRFACNAPEEQYAAEYLLNNQPDLNVIVPLGVYCRTYLDTFDNARLLRAWLQKEELWPLEEVTLYCNAPHSLRSAVLFRLCGFNVQRVIGCRPRDVQRKIVPRLWFYDYPLIQSLYEGVALIYDFGRWIEWKLKTKNSSRRF